MRRRHRWFEVVAPDGHTMRICGDPGMPRETMDALLALGRAIKDYGVPQHRGAMRTIYLDIETTIWFDAPEIAHLARWQQLAALPIGLIITWDGELDWRVWPPETTPALWGQLTAPNTQVVTRLAQVPGGARRGAAAGGGPGR